MRVWEPWRSKFCRCKAATDRLMQIALAGERSGQNLYTPHDDSGDACTKTLVIRSKARFPSATRAAKDELQRK